MALLARRNLFHDKIRLGVTVTGIVFAIVLVTVQLGLFIGFTSTTSNVIDHSKVDLWVASSGIRNFDVGSNLSESKYYQVLAAPGVEKADKYIVRFTRWKRPDGAEESVEIVGFNPDTGFGGPWELIEGRIQDVKLADAVLIDESYKEKLGVSRVGEIVEINNYRARVVGFTRGIRSFTTSPHVFTSFKNSLNYAPRLNENQTVYILVKAAAGADIEQLRRHLLSRISDVDVFTNAEFSKKTRIYWMFTTGAGIGILIAAIMGLVVGIVVVAQTIYATTIDHIKEYGTLKAMGASNRYIYRVIIEQAVISAVLGYGPGMAVSLAVVRLSQGSGAAIKLPFEMAIGMFLLTLLMCIGASIVSINKVTQIDPAMVFKG